MRYLFGFLCVCALAALPQSAIAQAGEEGASAEPNAEQPVQSTEPTRSGLERWHPEAFVDPAKAASSSQAPSEEPVLKLEVDSAGLGVTPSAPRTVDGDTLEEARSSVRGPRAGVIISSIVLAGGVAAIAGGVRQDDIGSAAVAATFGLLMVIGGTVGMSISGRNLGAAKRELRLKEADSLRSRRIQWDPRTSRLVF